MSVGRRSARVTVEGEEATTRVSQAILERRLRPSPINRQERHTATLHIVSLSCQPGISSFLVRQIAAKPVPRLDNHPSTRPAPRRLHAPTPTHRLLPL